jgi:hypothetical protein
VGGGLQGTLPACPSVFVYGRSGTGKTAVVTALLAALQLPHAHVDCVAAAGSARLLFERALSGLAATGRTETRAHEGAQARTHAERGGEGAVPVITGPCDTAADFVRSLRPSATAAPSKVPRPLPP